MDEYRLLFIVLFTLFAFHTTCQNSYDGLKDVAVLARRKRYVVFPEGSTFSIAFCIQWQTMMNPPIFTSALNWAVSYELPNQTYRNPDTNHLVLPSILRRQRRELYRRLEVAMNSGGVDGRSCIQRALCEAAQRLNPRESIAEEILRVLFLLPLEKVDISEPIEHHVYDAAYRRGLSNRSCSDMFSTCPFSLIDIFLGTPKYD